jgi:hypothetical protein
LRQRNRAPSMTVVVVLSIVLRSFPNDRANPRARGAGNQSTLDAAAEHRTQYSPGCSPDQSTLTRADAPLVTVVVIVIVISAPAIISPLGSTSRSIVEVAIVVASILGRRRKPRAQDRAGKKHRGWY